MPSETAEEYIERRVKFMKRHNASQEKIDKFKKIMLLALSKAKKH